MKNLVVILVAFAGLNLVEQAIAVDKPVVPAAPEKVAGVAKSAPAPAEIKTIPMHSRADVIDLAGRTFTTKRKDGVEVRNVIPDGAEIKQGTAAAKLEDIKVGDYVSGSRRKLSDTEYTVVKITKFGPKETKKPK